MGNKHQVPANKDEGAYGKDFQTNPAVDRRNEGIFQPRKLPRISSHHSRHRLQNIH